MISLRGSVRTLLVVRWVADNFRIDVTSDGSLESIMKIAFSKTPNGAASYTIRDPVEIEDWRGKFSRPLRLIFFWSLYPLTEDIDMFAFSNGLSAEEAADFARRWLEQIDYGPEPDHDGSNTKGFRIYNERYGHVDDSSYGTVAITPEWIEYGK
jgi:hypothetical protein